MALKRSVSPLALRHFSTSASKIIRCRVPASRSTRIPASKIILIKTCFNFTMVLSVHRAIFSCCSRLPIKNSLRSLFCRSRSPCSNFSATTSIIKSYIKRLLAIMAYRLMILAVSEGLSAKNLNISSSNLAKRFNTAFTRLVRLFSVAYWKGYILLLPYGSFAHHIQLVSAWQPAYFHRREKVRQSIRRYILCRSISAHSTYIIKSNNTLLYFIIAKLLQYITYSTQSPAFLFKTIFKNRNELDYINASKTKNDAPASL